jgi:hypothetical protein
MTIAGHRTIKSKTPAKATVAPRFPDRPRNAPSRSPAPDDCAHDFVDLGFISIEAMPMCTTDTTKGTGLHRGDNEQADGRDLPTTLAHLFSQRKVLNSMRLGKGERGPAAWLRHNIDSPGRRTIHQAHTAQRT